jgi:hypothetical protein
MTGYVIPSSHYSTSTLYQDILSMRYMYMKPTCMDPTLYASLCKVNVR